MKKTAKILALLLLAVTTMVSCTKNNSSNDGNQSANLIVGKWKCVNYSETGGDYDLARVGSIWDFNSEGTLEFDTYYNYSSQVKHLSIAYLITDKILVMFIPYETLSLHISELSKEKLVLDLGDFQGGFHYEFEKEQE